MQVQIRTLNNTNIKRKPPVIQSSVLSIGVNFTETSKLSAAVDTDMAYHCRRLVVAYCLIQ